MEFSGQLTRERKARGLSQQELAEKVGVSRQAVSKWETGEAAPDLPKLLALAEVLDISLDRLCGREEASQPPEASVPVPARRGRSYFPALAAVLLAAGVLLGRWSAPPAALLPDAVTVSGVTFSPEGTGQVSFVCTPSVADPVLTYQVIFSDGDGEVLTAADAPCTDGICGGTVVLPDRGAALVTLTVSDGRTSRAVPLAENLTLEETQASWLPLT